jgi:hypothetical protein
MRTRSPAAVLVAAALLLAGCSGGPGGPTSSSSPSASAHVNAQAAMLAVSRCMRAHGYPSFPDPVQGPDGQWDWPPVVDHLSVSTACDQLVRQAKAANRQNDPQKVDAATLGKLRQYAQCMRQHGVPDWPDPTGIGSFKLPPRLQPRSAESLWRDADSQCHQFIPAKGIMLEREAG